MRVGIFFGGRSREREISFAGGRTVYDNLDKSLFDPVPIFVDSLGNFILLDWKYLYKGTIRDFYPSPDYESTDAHYFQIYVESLAHDQQAIDRSIQAIGKPIEPSEFRHHIDFAFLTLHGPYGEDGNIQGILEWQDIPYSGAGILPSSIGIDKSAQREIIKKSGYNSPKSHVVSRKDWITRTDKVIDDCVAHFEFPIVIKAPHQGSSIGVNIVKSKSELIEGFNRSFFIEQLSVKKWKSKSEKEKYESLVKFTDIREGLGFPVMVDSQYQLDHPMQLWKYLDETTQSSCQLEAINGEAFVLLESFIEGKEFSCIVIEDEKGNPVALPPTEIKKSKDIFDYRSKYLPGISRKITPIELPKNEIDNIRLACEKLYTTLHSEVYARIDGFINSSGTIFLNDPNTTSGMLPSSFFFHQAAEIGFNPSQFITFIIERSLKARYKTGKNFFKLEKQSKALSDLIKNNSKLQNVKTRIGVFMGGFSSERHISIESGRNIYEKLASSDKYTPIPIFLTGNEEQHELYILPINIMLKDNADDIKLKVESGTADHAVIQEINALLQETKTSFVGHQKLVKQKIDYDELKGLIDFAFIALHGRPGEDGAVQERLDMLNIGYNGSGVSSSQLTINKFDTNNRLAEHGILVAKHRMVQQKEYEKDLEKLIKTIEADFSYPFIAKPADDGCSSAVKKIKNREELQAFCDMMFRPEEEFLSEPCRILHLLPNEEFPRKSYFLVEELITANGADHFMEITGGVITNYKEDGAIDYIAFEPSEALASGEILSLEEKFLAGEGQNITPARFGKGEHDYDLIANQVKNELIKTAQVCDVEGYCRIDAFVRIWKNKVETIIIEINSLPGMTPATAIFHQAALNHMKPYQFIDSLIAFGFKKLDNKTNTIQPA